METKLEDYNLMPGTVPMNLVLFRDAIEHSASNILYTHNPGALVLCNCYKMKLTCHAYSFLATFAVTRAVRVISQLRGSVLLVGVGGSGRQSLSKMAAFICEYQVFQVEVTKHYRKMEFREGETGMAVSIIFSMWKLYNAGLELLSVFSSI